MEFSIFTDQRMLKVEAAFLLGSFGLPLHFRRRTRVDIMISFLFEDGLTGVLERFNAILGRKVH